MILLTTGVVAALTYGRFPAGGLPGWHLRFGAVLHDLRALGSTPRSDSGTLARQYAGAQQTVPAGVRLGIWVDRADLVDYTTHHVIDLRNPSTRTCGVELANRARRTPGCARLARLLLATEVRYVLVSSDAPPVGFAPEAYRFGPVDVVDLRAP